MARNKGARNVELATAALRWLNLPARKILSPPACRAVIFRRPASARGRLRRRPKRDAGTAPGAGLTARTPACRCTGTTVSAAPPPTRRQRVEKAGRRGAIRRHSHFPRQVPVAPRPSRTIFRRACAAGRCHLARRRHLGWTWASASTGARPIRPRTGIARISAEQARGGPAKVEHLGCRAADICAARSWWRRSRGPLASVARHRLECRQRKAADRNAATSVAPNATWSAMTACLCCRNVRTRTDARVRRAGLSPRTHSRESPRTPLFSCRAPALRAPKPRAQTRGQVCWKPSIRGTRDGRARAGRVHPPRLDVVMRTEEAFSCACLDRQRASDAHPARHSNSITSVPVTSAPRS